MTTIPDVQAEMLRWAASLRMFGFDMEPWQVATKLEGWVEALYRRKAVHHGRATSDRVTAGKRRAVLAWHLAHPDDNFHEIARRFNLNPGRVSEILAGKRR
jgi:hypothetical protein